MLTRGLAWPVAASIVGLLVGAGASLAATSTTGGSPATADVGTDLVVAVLLALGARFLREMKQEMPISLLTPIPTAFGDLSAVRILAWQADSLLVVVVGAAVTTLLPVPWSVALAVGIATTCFEGGLARVGSSSAELARRSRRAPAVST